MMLRGFLEHPKVDTALGVVWIVLWVVLTLWLLAAVVTGSVMIVRAIEDVF